MEDNKSHAELDLLRRIETLAEKMNERMASRNKSIVLRYPLTFALIALVGVMTVTEGVKGLIQKIDYLRLHPAISLILGLAILITIGSLYKKLDK
jgi:hypothetical protein